MLKGRSGFTLIETTIALALTVGAGFFFVGFFTGLRNQVQFSDSIDSLKNEVLAKRQEALSTIKLSGGVDPLNISVGRLLTFTPGATTVRVDALYTANTSGAPSATQQIMAPRPATDTSNINIPWTASYLPSCTGVAMIAFIRNPVDGSLMTSATQTGWTEPYAYGTLTGAVAQAATFKIPITGSGKKGYLTVDAKTGSITVEHLEDTAVLKCP